MLKHVSTRWLSLESAVTRTLEMYQPLKSYVLSGSDKQPRFKRMASSFQDPMTEINLLFYQFVLQQFVAFSLFLQKEEPRTHLLDAEMQSFLRKILIKFVKVRPLKEAVSPLEVDITNSDNLLSLDDIQIGFTTRQTLNKLENEGDIAPAQKSKFLEAALEFYTETAKYVVKTFPYNDLLLGHAKFVDFEQRLDVSFANVLYFVERFPRLLHFSDREMDILTEQFKEYQLLPNLPDYVEKEASVCDQMADGTQQRFLRMDVVWSMYIKDKLPLLFKVAQVLLIIPHSNAEEERVFSMVRKNKTDFRASLSTDGSLSSILKVKLNNKEPSHKYEPSKTLVDKSKKVTWEYNKEHQ